MSLASVSELERLKLLENRISDEKRLLHASMNSLFIVQAFLFAGFISLIGQDLDGSVIGARDEAGFFFDAWANMLFLLPAVGAFVSLLMGASMSLRAWSLIRFMIPAETRLFNELCIPKEEWTVSARDESDEIITVVVFVSAPWAFLGVWGFIFWSSL